MINFRTLITQYGALPADVVPGFVKPAIALPPPPDPAIQAIQDFMLLPNYKFISAAFHSEWNRIGRSNNPDDFQFHMIYAHLLECTGMLSIFEQLVKEYTYDQRLGTPTEEAFQWKENTYNLFFADSSNSDAMYTTGSNGDLYRDSSQSRRLNAYLRLFGHPRNSGLVITGTPQNVNMVVPQTRNDGWRANLLKLLNESWQAYTNANNALGQDTTDPYVIVDIAEQIQTDLLAQRGGRDITDNFVTQNLAFEEFKAVFMLSWFHFTILYNSPLMRDLNIDATTPGGRLRQLAKLVGRPNDVSENADDYLQLALHLFPLMRAIEFGSFNDVTVLANIQELGQEVNRYILGTINYWQQVFPKDNLKQRPRVTEQAVVNVN